MMARERQGKSHDPCRIMAFSMLWVAVLSATGYEALGTAATAIAVVTYLNSQIG